MRKRWNEKNTNEWTEVSTYPIYNERASSEALSVVNASAESWRFRLQCQQMVDHTDVAYVALRPTKEQIGCRPFGNVGCRGVLCFRHCAVRFSDSVTFDRRKQLRDAWVGVFAHVCVCICLRGWVDVCRRRKGKWVGARVYFVITTNKGGLRRLQTTS